VQSGKIDLKKDINTCLTRWKFPYNTLYATKPVTLEAILSHTAGLSVSGFPGYGKDEKLPTVIQILDGQAPANTAPVRSIAGPAERFIYSGGGITISQLIVEEVSGLPYDRFMKEFVLLPLGMKQSSFSQPPRQETYNIWQPVTLRTVLKSKGSFMSILKWRQPDCGPHLPTCADMLLKPSFPLPENLMQCLNLKLPG